MTNVIPKIIHYVWVGDKEKPQLVLNCIESWKKFCPDYELIEWGNDFVKNTDNLYVKQAFKCRKWAFVSDYIRLYALKEFGGFYFDTDLELTNSIEKFRCYDFVTGYEKCGKNISPITAFMGSLRGNGIVSELLDEYNTLEFVKNGDIDETTNTVRISCYLSEKYGIRKPYKGDNVIFLGNNAVIFPYYFFCTPVGNKENYAVHHFDASWLPEILRREKLRIGKYSIVRFKSRKGREIISALPIDENEKVLYRLNVWKNKIYCLVKRNY